MPPRPVCLFLGAVVFAILAPTVRAQYLPMNTWTGAVSNRWEVAGNWSLGHVPNSGEDATIANDQTVVAAGPIICSSLYISKGHLVASGDLDLFTSHINPGGTLTLAGSSGRTFKGWLVCQGTIVWEGGDIDGQLHGTHLSSISLQIGGVIIDRADGAVIRNNLTMSVFSTYRKEGGTSEIAVPLIISGPIEVTTGSVAFTKLADVFNKLRVSASAGTQCLLANVTDTWIELPEPPEFSGPGKIVLDGFYFGVVGGTVSFRHRMGGSLTIPTGSSITIEGTADTPCYVHGTISNHGTLLWKGLRMEHLPSLPAWTASLTNENDGVFASAGEIDSTIDLNKFTNNGTLRHLGPATLYLGSLQNQGPIKVEKGTLEVTDLDSNDAAIEVAPGTSAHFNTVGTTANLGANASFGGGGEIALSGDISGTVRGDVRLREQFAGTLNVAEGSTMTIAEPPATSHQLLGHLFIDGNLIWESGDIVTCTSSYGGITIRPTGRFEIRTDGTCEANLALSNQGVITKSAGAGTTKFLTTLSNSGTVEIVCGTLAVDNIYQLAGTTHLAGGNLCLLSPQGGAFVGGLLTGSGMITGDLRFFRSTLALDQAPGQTLKVQGNVSLETGSMLAIAAGSASPSDLSRLVVNGTANLGGTLSFSTTAGFTPVWLARLPFLSAQSVTGTFDAGQFPAPPESTHYEISYKPTAAEVCVVPPPFPGWQYTHFGDNSDPAIVGETADPDADGIPNLLEYALGSNPLAPETTDNPAVFIKEEVGDMMTWSYLCMTYRQPVAASAVELIPEISDDLTTWTSGSSRIDIRTESITDGVRTITVRGLFPISFNPRQFFRLRAVRVQ